MTPETATISEIHPGVFSVLLWGPNTALFSRLLDPTLPYVLAWQHQTGRFTWEAFQLPVVEPESPIPVFGRHALFDFVASTDDFLTMAPKLRPAIRAVQLHAMPPDCLDLTRITGRERFRLLAECGWHLLIDTPANDFGQLASPSRELLEQAVKLHGDD